MRSPAAAACARPRIQDSLARVAAVGARHRRRAAEPQQLNERIGQLQLLLVLGDQRVEVLHGAAHTARFGELDDKAETSVRT